MYNILELRSKSQDELLRIAQELGVKKANSLAPDALVYAILDQQAIVTSVDNKDESKAKKQRARIAKKVVAEEGGISVIEKTITTEPKADKKSVESPSVVANTTPKEPIVAEKAKEANKTVSNKQKNSRFLSDSRVFYYLTTAISPFCNCKITSAISKAAGR